MPDVDDVEIAHPVLLIRINRLYRPSMSSLELYEATRGVWVVGGRREKVRYAFAVFESTVKEVYEVLGWQPAGTDHYATRPPDDVKRPRRWEFVGRVADASVRDRYVGASIGQYFRRGAQNPVTYAGPEI